MKVIHMWSEKNRALGRKILLFIISGIAVASLGAAEKKDKAYGADLYQLTRVHTVHFKFTAEQWEKMEPEGGGFGPLGGGPRGPGGPGRPGGPQMAPFGPGTFVAPAFMTQGDKNEDRKLSRAEFNELGEKWFSAWDKEKRGKINANEIREGLNTSLGPPRGAPGGGRGGGMPGLNLQGPEGKRNGLAAAAGIEFEYVTADIEIEGKVMTNVAVRYKGNGTWMQSRGTDKRSMKVDLNEFVKGQKIGDVSKLNFHNNVTDASSMNEPLSYLLYRDAGVPASRTAYARVYVTVPGKWDRHYLGLYSMVENVDNNFADERFGTKKGAIFKPVTPRLFDDLGTDWSNYKQTYDPKDDLDASDAQRVMSFAKIVTHGDDAEFEAKLPEYVDLEEFARYMAVTVWLSTLDSILGPGQNFYMYLHPKTRKFQFIPWDLDHSFGQFGLVGSQDQREKLSIHKPWQGENRFLERVFKVEAFKKLYLARMEEFSKTIFEPQRFHKQVDEVAAAIRPAIAEEPESRLDRFDKVVKGEPVEPAGFGPPPGERRVGEAPPGPRFGGFMQPSKPIKGFVTARAEAVKEQLAGKSQGETVERFGFGGPGRGGPGGGFGPGMFLGGPFLTALDEDKSGEVTKEEFRKGFEKWFASWDKEKSGVLTEENLREGINQDLSAFRGGFPPGGGRSFNELRPQE